LATLLSGGMEKPRGQKRRHGKAIALAALAVAVALVLLVSLGVMPALEQKTIQAELAAQEAAEQAERAAQEKEAEREAWRKLGDPTLVYESAREVLERAQGEESEQCYSPAVRDNLLGDPEYVRLTLKDYQPSPEHCRTREEEVQQARQALGARRPERPSPPALTYGTLEESDGATYDPKIHRWDRLPPAVTPRSSNDCVGYCFNAIIASVSKENRRVARVVVFEEDGTPARAIVHRTRISNGSRMAAREGKRLRFACFDRFETPGGSPRFEECVQAETARRRRPKPEVHDDPFEDPLGDHPFGL